MGTPPAISAKDPAQTEAIEDEPAHLAASLGTRADRPDASATGTACTMLPGGARADIDDDEALSSPHADTSKPGRLGVIALAPIAAALRGACVRAGRC